MFLKLSDSIGLVSLVVSIVGFIATLTQVHRTRKAAEAARAASSETSDALGRAQILSLIDRLSQTDREIMWASANEDHRSLLHHVKAWESFSDELAGLFEVRGEFDFLEALKASSEAANEARQGYLDSQETLPSVVTRPLRREIGPLIHDLGRFAARLRNEVSQEPASEDRSDQR